ncbi:hypothetical protein SLS53_009120 [Cytospora paraplurivora]|uniref:Uncharacterized protein n=1 Tax=Cytospora paraplurivora TaxID=2898453 RepID=A0AAN9YAI2_9PEZI
MAAPKIFVIGDLNGRLQPAFTKITALHSKNNFSFALVVGNLFGPEDDDAVTDLLTGKIEVPLPTYFTVGTHALPERIVEKIVKEEEICPNLHYLNKRGVTKISEGVRIVTLGGVLDPEILGGQSKEQHLPFHTPDDAKALRGANSADILLTAMWPSMIWNRSKVALPFDPSSAITSDAVADLSAALKPRYHFCPSPSAFFYEREPYFNPPKDGASEQEMEITRFISIAPFGNSEKAKAMYAFTLASTSGALPQGSTVSPFLTRSDPSKKRPAPTDEGFSRFANGDQHRPSRARKGGRGQRLPPRPEDCWLCLASENVATHMISSIGEDTYLATARGPLPTPTVFAQYGLEHAGHMLIAPQEHVSTVSRAAMGQDVADRTFAEMSRFRESLQAMVSTKSKHKLGAVTWEINKVAGIHAHWQFMPITADMVKKGLVEAAFRVEAENLHLPALIVKDFGISDEVPGDYIRIWIWCEDEGEGTDDGGKIISKSLLMRWDESVRFDLQYPRKVMAKLLGLENRMFWQDWRQTDEEETQDTARFRDLFQPWDFTLTD